MGLYWAEMADENQTEGQVQFLKNHLKPYGCMLDLACGSGRHSIALAKDNYSMLGLDISRKLLKIAKQRSPDLPLVLGDIRYLPFKTSTFAAAISMDTSFGYLPLEADDKTSLDEFRRILSPEGLLIIDIFNQEHLAIKYRGRNEATKDKQYPRFILQKNRAISSNGNWLCDSWIIHDKLSGQTSFFNHKVRLYKLNKLWGFLEGAGFRVNQILGNYDGGKFGVDSPRLIFLATPK